MIQGLVCEGVGIRSIGRILQIGVNTVVRKIVKMANSMVAPEPELSAALEVDELWTYIGRKDNEYWVAYALNRKTRQVVDFVIGKRTKATLEGTDRQTTVVTTKSHPDRPIDIIPADHPEGNTS
jgi:hypothetical protein